MARPEMPAPTTTTLGMAGGREGAQARPPRRVGLAPFHFSDDAGARPIASMGTAYTEVRAVTNRVLKSAPPKVAFEGCSGKVMTPRYCPLGLNTWMPSAVATYRLPRAS